MPQIVSMTSTSAAPIVCPGHSRPIVDIRFCRTSEDNLDLLLSACHDKTAQLRWADNGAWIGTYKGHTGAVWSAALDEAGLRTITASADFSVKLWDTITGEEISSFPHQHVVKAVDFSFDSKSFISAGLEKKSFVFDLQHMTPVTVYDHPCQVSKAIWISHDVFLTGAYDGVLRTFDRRVSTHTCASSVPLPADAMRKLDKGVTDIQFVKQSNKIITCRGQKILLFSTEKIDQPFFSFNVQYDVEAASLSCNGERIAAGGSDLWLRIYDALSGDELGVHKGHHGPIFCARWSSLGDSVASGSEDGTIRIWPISAI